METMLEYLISSKARVEVLKLFFFNPENRYYQRQISSLTHQPIRAIQREVERMEKLGLLETIIEGNRNYYKLKHNTPYFNEIRGIVLKSVGIADTLKIYLANNNNIQFAFIYGSYARNQETSDSDIDLFIIGDVSAREMSKVLSKPKSELGREINYAIFALKEYRDKVKAKDHFISSVANNEKIFLIGTEHDLKAALG